MSHAKLSLFLIVILSLTVSLSVSASPTFIHAYEGYITPSSNTDIIVQEKEETKEKPLRIVIPRIGVDISIDEAEFNQGTWDISEIGATYGSGSGYINDEHSNVIIFGHARKGIFRDLPKVTYNDMIYVYSDTSLYGYEINTIELINPEDIDKVVSHGDHHITLFTCDGEEDQERFLVKGKRLFTYSITP